jgi:dynein heavy chain 2
MQGKLTSWLEDIFYKALDWVLLRDDQFVVETTKVGIVNNALSFMKNVESKGAFVNACLKGLGGNFIQTLRSEFYSNVFTWAGERPADPANLINNYWDEK